MPPRQPPKRKVAVKPKAPAKALTDAERAERIAQTARAYSEIAKSPYFLDTLGVKSPVAADLMGETGLYGYYDPRRDAIFVNPGQPVEKMSRGGAPADDRTARQVLTHEGAHALDKEEDFPSFYSVNRPLFRALYDKEKGVVFKDALKSSDIQRVMPNRTIDRFNMQDKTSLQPKTFFGIPYGEGFQPMPPSEAKAIQALSPYYAIGGISAKDPDRAITDPSESFAQAYTNAAEFLSQTAGDTTGFREKLGRYEGNTPGAGAIVRDLLTGRSIYKQHPLKGVIR